MEYCNACGRYPCMCVRAVDTPANEVNRLLNEMEVALRSMRNPSEAKKVLRAALQRHGRRVGERTGD